MAKPKVDCLVFNGHSRCTVTVPGHTMHKWEAPVLVDHAGEAESQRDESHNLDWHSRPELWLMDAQVHATLALGEQVAEHDDGRTAAEAKIIVSLQDLTAQFKRVADAMELELTRPWPPHWAITVSQPVSEPPRCSKCGAAFYGVHTC